MNTRLHPLVHLAMQILDTGLFAWLEPPPSLHFPASLNIFLPPSFPTLGSARCTVTCTPRSPGVRRRSSRWWSSTRGLTQTTRTTAGPASAAGRSSSAAPCTRRTTRSSCTPRWQQRRKIKRRLDRAAHLLGGREILGKGGKHLLQAGIWCTQPSKRSV